MIENLKNKWEKIPEKKRQLIRAAGVIGIVVIIAVIINLARENNRQLYNKKQSKIDFSGITQKTTVESAWLERSEDQLDDLKNQLDQEKKDKEDLSRRIEELTAQIEEAKEQSKSELQNQINDLKNQLNKNSNSAIKNDNQKDIIGNDPFARGSNNIDRDSNNFRPEDSSDNQLLGNQIDLISFASDSDSDRNAFLLDNYLPAGAYVRAVMISSVDASVGITAQSDPRPVLFRIISNARSAVEKDKQLTIDIKGCTITGAATGDLSSERAYVRLLKMTCSNKDGRVIETDVEGYAADGSDGKAGITGKKITREGDLVGKSFLTGMVSGLGQGLSQKIAPPLNFSNGLTTQSALSTEDVIRSGVAKGASVTGNNLSTYFINRAEQYQPVISVASGKEVELVFLSGTYLDGRKLSKNDFKTTNETKK